MKKAKRNSSIFDNTKVLFIISLFIAIIAWFLMIFFVNPEKTKTISDVSIKLNTNYTTVEKLELQAIEGLEQKVDVLIYGNRSVVDTVTSSDFTVYASLGEVTGPGEYELNLIGEKNSNKNFDIQIITPQTVKVKFDRLVSKTFTVEVNIAGLSVESGFVAEDYTVSPLEVILTGPAEKIESISKCTVQISLSSPISSTVSFKNQSIKLLDASGREIDSEHITFDKSTANVTIPVLKIKKLPIEVSFINIPSYFSQGIFEYNLSNDEILIAGPAAIVDNYSSIQVGYVDLKTLTPSSAYLFDINLPTGFVNMENIEEVAVAFNMKEYVWREISVQDIRIINQPANYDVSVVTKKINDIVLYGEKEVLDSITTQDVIAEIDMGVGNIAVGQGRVPVSIYIPSKSTVWAYGDYSVIIDVSEKTE